MSEQNNLFRIYTEIAGLQRSECNVLVDLN